MSEGALAEVITLHPNQDLEIVTDRQSGDDERSFKHGDGNGGGDDMLARVKKLEDDMQTIKTDLAVMKSNYATTTNVSDAKNSIIMWVVSAILLAQVLPPLLKKFGI